MEKVEDLRKSKILHSGRRDRSEGIAATRVELKNSDHICSLDVEGYNHRTEII